MKKSIFLFLALVAGAINVFAQSCVQTPSTLKGTASVSFTRFAHKHLPGMFSVKVSSGDTVFVFFSQGNLQYQASTSTWRFAENQYDVIGDAAGNTTKEANRSTQSQWIDLFGWATSGYDNGATVYQPYAVSQENSEYFNGGDLTRGNSESNWPYHNAIINGGLDANGPAAQKWRTLTSDEWDFLFSLRKNATNLYGMGTLNSVYGVFILPDGWNWADVDGGTFESGWTPASSSTAFSANVVTNMSLWETLENAGVVFLPVTGNRLGVKVRSADAGYYWSSTATSTGTTTKFLYFADEASLEVGASLAGKDKKIGKAVRAVRELMSVDE